MNIGVIGAGNWGTALAKLLTLKGHQTTVWAYEKEVAMAINERHNNPLYLSGVDLPKGLTATNDIAEAIEHKEFIVFVVPSHVARATAKTMAKYLNKNTIFVSCTKGIEFDTGKLISDVLNESLPDFPVENICFLSGPSFAKEVALGLPTTVVIASKNSGAARKAQELFRTDYFMAFTSDDVIGIQVGGAVKNVIAIACGISDGLVFGHKSRSSMITRGQ